jgi:glycerol-3-phosphate O-acyltransferase
MTDKSQLVGLENAKKIQELVKKGENVIILSNHQTEVDPQAISILLEKVLFLFFQFFFFNKIN